MQRELTGKEQIEGGLVMGAMSTNKSGSECVFPVCTVENYKTMTDEELDKALVEAMWWSEQLKVHIPGRAELK